MLQFRKILTTNYKCAFCLWQRLNLRLSSTDTNLRNVLAEKIPKMQERLQNLKQNHGSFNLDSVTVNALYGGLRGVKILNCETSHFDAENGIRFRGYTLADCQKMLPKAAGGEQALPESTFWLLVTGDIPTDEQVRFLSHEWAERAALPCHVVTMLNNFPKSLHPMAQLNCAVAALNHDSKFLRFYNEGLNKQNYWEYVYEDGMDLIAKLPVIAATIYCNTYREGKGNFAVDCDVDWSANFVRMLGFKDANFTELIRLFLSIHSDHEAGNISTHTIRLVGSALSDPFMCFAAGISGLAGPSHGLANNEVIAWLQKIKAEVGLQPSTEQLADFICESLKSSSLVPGYEHSDLRTIDSRAVIFSEFGQKYLPDNEMLHLVTQVFIVLPKILSETGKVQNLWPNVDAHSAILLEHYGMKEMQFYTVLFSVSRALGAMAQLIWDRALLLPLEKPASIATDNLIVLLETETMKQLETPPSTPQISSVKLNEKSMVQNNEVVDTHLTSEKV